MQKHRFNASRALAAASLLSLAGCGVWQATRDTTVSAAEWVFTTQVKTMNVELTSRAALNENTTGQPLSTVIRLYQLKDSKTFAQLEYVQLQNADLELLKADLVATKDVVLRPDASATVSEPMQKDAEYVGVVAFFRSPSSASAWKLLIPKKQWKDTDPVKIVVKGNLLTMEGADPKPVRRDAPQQSVPKSGAMLDSAASGVSRASAAGKAAAQNAGAAADALTDAKASAASLTKSAAGLISN
ncbi:lipoprotein [Caballeronia fortuita]|uniref:Lipoprotein n=1 Tax=Caballeronia fortuita TaxID=1777138 RepID=A0A158DPC1_9BURK|nr:type VI secretion system lipoprotein TssJ [Caballeronia fortuita]SAK96469.1 lipoprotein [Caballeronia fortuita]